MSTGRATWTFTYEKGLVDIMKELVNIPTLRGQNGWNAEGWRSIVNKFNERFPMAHFTKQQVQEKEKELKGNYKVIRDARKSGVGWNDTLGMINAEPDQWKKLIADNSKVAKFQKKPFPLFNICEELYEGSIAIGDLNFTSTSIRPPRTRQRVEPTAETSNQRMEPTSETSEQGAELPPRSQLLLPQRSISEQSVHQTSARNPFSSSLDGFDGLEVQSAPSNQILHDQDIGRGRKRKQNPMAVKLGQYIDLKQEQYEETSKMIEEKKRREEAYSIQNCIDMVDAIEDLTNEEKAAANELFQSETNRMIFVGTRNPNVRLIWLKNKLCSSVQKL
ncbi:unnamed protein product [Urochloa decumbens]|uniref:Myb/SANT-like domain-containing protein n=1 Tax=Urochloa decumbens TaxID=240449 RepID=A0ABC9BJM4_9POAL